MARKVSINDIARELKVSKTTVSFVLNGKGDENKISKITQQRILALIKAWNYQPNKLAQALKRGESKTIGYLVPDIGDPFYARIARLIEGLCSGEGYQLIMGSTGEDKEKEEKLLGSILNQQVDALITAPTQLLNPIYLSRLESGFPMVVFDRFTTGIDSNNVGVENIKSMQKVVQMLIDEGFNRIGLVSLEPIISTLSERLESYRHTLQLNGMPVDEDLIHVVSKHGLGEDISEVLKSLFKNGCNGIVATNNLVATELIKQLNTDYPEKLDTLRLGVFDNLDLFDFVRPRIISVAQPVDQIATKIVELLHESMKNSNIEKSQYILTPEIIRR
ncbi:MAG: LacI family DNA-binding transcriptional regulator [Bacteroidota bacterium]